MKNILKSLLFSLMLIGLTQYSLAQDPHFSQFFSSPLTLNPALTGNTDADWRMMTNYRQEYIGPSAPFNTITASFDVKIMNKISTPNFWALGIMFMNDQSLQGASKSNYASLNSAYHIVLDGDEKQHLGLGLAAIYGSRSLDFSQLTFEHQFTSLGFNTSLPTGENNLSNMKSYLSVAGGLLYRYTPENINFELGVAAFHLNKPKQTFLSDDKQKLPVRYVVNTAFDAFLSERLILNTNAVYQRQAGQNYISVGSAIGLSVGMEQDVVFNLGCWYRSNDAVYPYLSLELNNLQFGFTYDVTVNKLKNSVSPPKSWELSITFRKKKKEDGDIPCPPSLWR